eukprot:2377189-Amphidinium_carterae.1
MSRPSSARASDLSACSVDSRSASHQGFLGRDHEDVGSVLLVDVELVQRGPRNFSCLVEFDPKPARVFPERSVHQAR